MVSDSEMGTDDGSTDENKDTMMEEESASTPSFGENQEKETTQEEGLSTSSPGEASTKQRSRGGGRRAALKIIRQNVEAVSRDLAGLRKSHEAGSNRLEKQVASLRNEVNALKSHIAKESARARSKQEASFTRIMSKLSSPKPKAKRTPKKKNAKTKSKGKK